MRVVVELDHGGSRLWSGSGREVTASFPELDVLADIAPRAVLDGEVVAFGPDGRPDFATMQTRMHVSTDREARRRAVTSRLPRQRRGPSGRLAERRRTQPRLLIVALIVLNVLVWLSSGDPAVRLGALVLTALFGPLVHILMTKN